MTKTQAAKIRLLRAKIEAGVDIKDSEWLPWQKPVRSLKYSDDRSETTLRHEYLAAMGIKDEADANPAAIYWDAYEALERGESCEVCGRRGEKLCRPCYSWNQSMAERQSIRRRVAS